MLRDSVKRLDHLCPPLQVSYLRVLKNFLLKLQIYFEIKKRNAKSTCRRNAKSTCKKNSIYLTIKKRVKKNLQRLQTEWRLIYQTPQKRNRHLGVTQRG